VKRHRALVPLSHDHHQALVAARRLRRGAEGADPAAAAHEFLRFFAADSVPHFRAEEERLFPLAADVAEATEPIVRALLEHQRLHARAARLAERLEGGEDATDAMRELGELLEAHVRYEERELFPLLERLLDEAALASVPREDGAVPRGGPVWGLESDDLNATLLAWDPGAELEEHVNEERDVLVAVVDGTATVTVGAEARELGSGEATIVAKGEPRRIAAGPAGVRYLSVHLRRPRLQIRSR